MPGNIRPNGPLTPYTGIPSQQNMELPDVRWITTVVFMRTTNIIGISRRDIANLIKWHPRPTEATAGTGSSPALAQEIAAYERANQDLYAMLFLLTEKPASLLVLNYEDETGTTGDGQKTLQELVSKYNKVTDEVIQATHTY